VSDRAVTERRVPEEVATQAAMGMLFASGAARQDGSGRPGVDVRVDPQALQRVHTIDLLRVVAQRLLWSVTSRIRKITRR
jgi:type II secretory pathway component HofQ